MPRRGNRRKKRRTHVKEDGEVTKDVPRSMIFRRGAVTPPVLSLIDDLRQVFRPCTATSLKESSKNKLKDFLHVAAPLGVSHFLTLSQTDLGTNMRMMRLPNGPTMCFRMEKFSLMSDVCRAARRPVAPNSSELRFEPLVVLNGFGNAKSPELKKRKQLLSAMFQNLFPTLDINKIRLSNCRRLVLFHFDDETEEISFRHFAIRAAPVGVQRSVKKVVKEAKRVPDLNRFSDISDYVLDGDAGYYSSDSEAEDTPESKVILPQSLGRSGKSEKSQQSALRLREVGPRLTLSLIKIEEGINEGRVLYHKFVKRAPEEIAAQQKEKREKAELKAQRRAAQEANVKRKQEEQQRNKEEKLERRRKAREEAILHAEAMKDDSGDDADLEEHDIEDVVKQSDDESANDDEEHTAAGVDMDDRDDDASAQTQAPSTSTSSSTTRAPSKRNKKKRKHPEQRQPMSKRPRAPANASAAEHRKGGPKRNASAKRKRHRKS